MMMTDLTIELMNKMTDGIIDQSSNLLLTKLWEMASSESCLL